MTCEILLAAIGFIAGPLVLIAIFHRNPKDETSDLSDEG
jgi:hypothetical protein